MSSDRTLADRLKDSILGVTNPWAKQRKREERDASARENRRARMIRASDYYNFRSAAFEVMEQAYMAASANDTLPAMARQVMYQARPFIQDKMGGQQLNDQYFCQQLLPDYIEEHGVDWDITYDERGHFVEPHTEHSIGLGTISVRNYRREGMPQALQDAALTHCSAPTHVRFIPNSGHVRCTSPCPLRPKADKRILPTGPIV